MTVLALFIICVVANAVEDVLRERAEKLKVRRLDLEYKLRQLERHGVPRGPYATPPQLQRLSDEDGIESRLAEMRLHARALGASRVPNLIHVAPCTYDGAGVCVKCNRPPPTSIPSAGVIRKL